MEVVMDTNRVDQLSKEIAAYCQKVVIQAKKPSKKRASPVLAVVITALIGGNTIDESGSWRRDAA
jgi:hypothetical protein